MQPHGSDRVRSSGGKLILHSAISKGWTPRTPKSGTHSEFPGTAVYWDEQYFEVLAAEGLPGGGVRYVLAPWSDSHTIRTFVGYDADSEARLVADHELARKQRAQSGTARFLAMFLGHLPSNVQNHLGNELGVSPAGMTLLSLIPGVALAGLFVWIFIDRYMKHEPAPAALLLLAIAMMFETIFRIILVLSQNRAVGSTFGTMVYVVYWLVAPNRARLVKPFASERGFRTPILIPPPEEVAAQDSLAVRSPFLTLLSPEEQVRLAERFGFDYREHASEVAWALLAVGALGIASSLQKAFAGTAGGIASSTLACLIVFEQATRLAAFKRGPAGSMFGVLVRPFVRDLLR